MKRLSIILQILLGVCLLSFIPHLQVIADTIYDSPYVSFSPDGRAWTTNAGEKQYKWYSENQTVSTGIGSKLRTLHTGEHYYAVRKTGTIPVGKWVVNHPYAECIHDSYQAADDYHGLDFCRKTCGEDYNSGWMAYCADCGQQVVNMLFYMSKEAAESIDYLEVDTGMDYYYICPYCRNLEQGREIPQHSCKAVSWNQYKVNYEANTQGALYGGYMNPSYHMYNNETIYEGNTIVPATRLTKNNYTRAGYEFAGWNTEADGSGVFFSDEAEVLNLTTYDCYQDNEAGVVTLYAQWKKSRSTLQIDLKGGLYEGKNGIYSIEQAYGTEYEITKDEIEAPRGYTISFETNGGTKVNPITGTKHFVEWVRKPPFQGNFTADTYYFVAPNGTVDTIEASYGMDSITLPNAYKRGNAFGGWYYDKEFKQPAGGAGAKIIPSKNITLYAQWVDLTLHSVDNYSANNGKGAVDLSWTQSDSNNKTYLLYQSLNQKDWVRINSANDIGTKLSVTEKYEYSGYSKTYTVPHTGLYTLTAYGAQGGNYGDYLGGKGGMATATFWLNKGEVLTYTIGGQNGYNGGGQGTMFANGGGATTIKSNQKGILIYAGGGGGATSVGCGKEGGSSASVIAGTVGESGGAGGGGGYRGGSAGEQIVHYHTEECYKIIDNSYILFDRDNNIISSWMEKYINGLLTYQNPDTQPDWLATQANYSINGTNTWYVGSDYSYLGIHTQDDGKDNHGQNALFWLGAANDSRDGASKWVAENCAPMTGMDAYIPVEGNTKADIYIHINAWNDRAELIDERSTLTIYNQEGQAVYNTTFTDKRTDYIYKDNERMDCDIYYKITAPLPEGTTHLYMVVGYRHEYANDGQENPGAWISDTIYKVAFSGGITSLLICGMEEGQVISSKPAYGGSSYVNTTHSSDYSYAAGENTGNGSVSIKAKDIGYLDVLKLDGVSATDLAAPDSVQTQGINVETGKEGVTIKALTGAANTSVKVIWTKPKDNGTDYYHKVESYLLGSANILCESNITKNTLVSGIKGYYYVVDGRSDTIVNKENSMFIPIQELTVNDISGIKFLHLAAVDVAGNIGETAHIRLGGDEVIWNLFTNPLEIREDENVYWSFLEQKYYVRCDNSTPFLLKFSGYMDGFASKVFQPNYVIYESLLEDEKTRNIVHAPTVDIVDGSYEERNISYSMAGDAIPQIHTSSVVIRLDKNRRIVSEQKFILEQQASGKSITMIPIVGADYKEGRLYSDYAADKRNGLTIIGDGEKPVIYGMDSFDSLKVIDRNAREVKLTLSAIDALSGLKEFGLKIANADNHIEETYLADEEGKITISITEDRPIFSGDFYVTAYAVDNVGNKSEMSREITEFALGASIQRILEPHEPIFKCGESGILTIVTVGYAERVEVEFPDEMLAQNPELNKVYAYTDCPEFRKEEKLQFMIPLYTPENENYQITVRAYKGDKKLEKFPSIALVEVQGSVLDDVRTRLR